MTKKIPKIAFIHGSDSDLPQMIPGLEYLIGMKQKGLVKLLWCDSKSQHRHTEKVQKVLRDYAEAPMEERPDFIIIGAGWANHLTGCSDAYLRYTLRNSDIIVIGVAFEDAKDPEHTDTAQRSIKHVPGTQVIYGMECDMVFTGEKGCLLACQSATIIPKDNFPKIKLKEPPPDARRTFEQAIEKAIELEKRSKA